jgi:hypothetical protein
LNREVLVYPWSTHSGLRPARSSRSREASSLTYSDFAPEVSRMRRAQVHGGATKICSNELKMAVAHRSARMAEATGLRSKDDGGGVLLLARSRARRASYLRRVDSVEYWRSGRDAAGLSRGAASAASLVASISRSVNVGGCLRDARLCRWAKLRPLLGEAGGERRSHAVDQPLGYARPR